MPPSSAVLFAAMLSVAAADNMAPTSGHEDQPEVGCESTEFCACRKLIDDDVALQCRSPGDGEFPELPVKFPGGRQWRVSSISFAHGGLTSLPPGSFRALPSMAVDLTGNALGKSGCSRTAFEGLEDILQALVLADCGLVRVPFALKNLTKLQTLQLDDNEISALRRGTFKTFDHLVELYLRRNALRRVGAGAFSGLAMLRELRLSFNRLSRLPARLFTPLRQLTTLDLSSNFLHRLAPGAFRGLRRMVWLELRSNLLHVVERATFAGLPALRNLDLAGNPILVVDAGTFVELRRLHSLSLDLSANATLSPKSLDGLKALRTLSFGKVGVETLPPKFFGELRSLRYLSIGADETGSGRGDRRFAGLRLTHFRSEFNFRRLSVWIGAIFQCRCSAEWIRELVERGSTVSGSCGSDKQVHCTAKQQPSRQLRRREHRMRKTR